MYRVRAGSDMLTEVYPALRFSLPLLCCILQEALAAPANLAVQNSAHSKQTCRVGQAQRSPTNRIKGPKMVGLRCACPTLPNSKPPQPSADRNVCPTWGKCHLLSRLLLRPQDLTLILIAASFVLWFVRVDLHQVQPRIAENDPIAIDMAGSAVGGGQRQKAVVVAD